MWAYDANQLTYNVSAPTGASSTTKVYCGDKGEPTSVYASEGTLSWHYNSATMTLELQITHLGPAKVVVDWRLLGDVNGDDKVDSLDLFQLGKAYGSDSSKPNWNPDCDFNWDGKIDISDISSLRNNYGKTQS